MTINWTFPRVYMPAPLWRVRMRITSMPPARRRAFGGGTAKPRSGPAGLDRDTARVLADAGYMPLRRYIELFGDHNAAEGEV